MIEHQLYRILSFYIGLAAMWVLFFWAFRDLSVDYYRQKMFNLRDDLFDTAASGMISFDHPAYVLLRKTMNGFLRYGHKITISGVVIQYLFLKRDLKQYKEQTFENQWEKVTKTLSEEQLEALHKYRRNMIKLVVTQACIGSPIIMSLMVLSIVLVVPAIIFWVLKNQIIDILTIKVEKRLGSMESAALAFGGA